MSSNIHPLLIALNKPSLNRSVLKDLINSKSNQESFKNYDPEKVNYISNTGTNVAVGSAKFIAYKKANPAKFVTSKPWKYFDLALEGGGSFGFAHLGTLHACAAKGIWFDRISGTSAGSISAAFVAAGYKIDLNYNIPTAGATSKLAPSQKNSLNKILFEDYYANFTDFGFEGKTSAQTLVHITNEVTNRNGFIYKFLDGKIKQAFDEKLNLTTLMNRLENSQDSIKSSIKSVITQIASEIKNFGTPLGKLGSLGLPGLNIGTAIDGAASTIKSATDILDAIEDKIKGALFGIAGFVKNITKTFLTEVVGLITEVILKTLIIPGGRIDYVRYGLFRLIEYGGFWNGDQLRDWIESHLQAGDVNPGTGKVLPSGKKAITFKDLKTDLCITASDFGPLDKKFISREAGIFFFSKKTTPDFPVAEAVRRSVSLPFAFIPRKMADGYGNTLRSSKFVVQQVPARSSRPATARSASTAGVSATVLLPTAGLKTLTQFKLVELGQEYDNNILLDGGFFQNLPVSVFRDRSNSVFDVSYDEQTDTFLKPMIISNLNTTQAATLRPTNVPAVEYPEPIKSIKSMLGEITLPSTSPGILNLNDAQGLRKTWRAIDAIGNYLANSKESETSILLDLVPNSVLINIPLRDTKAEDSTNGRIYLDSSVFNMPVQTKKWINNNSFNAAMQALKEYTTQILNNIEYAPYK